MGQTDSEADTGIIESLMIEPKIRKILAMTVLVAIKGLKSSAHSAIVPLVASFSAYEDYLNKTYSRVSTIKTFADPNKPVDLSSHFVSTNLSGLKNSINQDDVRKLLSDSGKLIISALAGFGKSVLMRYLALSFYDNPAGKIPIFIELRDLNRTQNPDLLSFIHLTYRQNSKLDKAVFERGLEQGIFVFFLDGYDEINYDHRDSLQQQILEISEKFPKVGLAVSSRPDAKFNGWERFTELNIEAMNLNQIKDLIGKIDYDADLKKNFLYKLSSGLYNKHKSFLSTPLLATLMMLTYQQNANIPDKMHLFYLRSFETLFDKHDTYKEQYERKRKSHLRVDQFAKLFSTFCFNSYIQEKFEFSKSDIFQYLEDAIAYCGYSINCEDFLFDLTESVCLIQLEGQFYSFVHRSFQEYFTAYFLGDCPAEFRDEFLNDFYFRPWDTVLPMLFDMCQDRIEASWVLPKIDSYLSEINSMKGALSRKAFVLVWNSVKLQKLNKKYTFSGFSSGPFRTMLLVLRAFYPGYFTELASYLSVNQVDEFLDQLCKMHNLEYDKLESLRSSRSAGNFKDIILDSDSNFPIRNDLSRIVLEEYKVILKIKTSVSDHKIVQQKFLAKIREKNHRHSL